MGPPPPKLYEITLWQKLRNHSILCEPFREKPTNNIQIPKQRVVGPLNVVLVLDSVTTFEHFGFLPFQRLLIPIPEKRKLKNSDGKGGKKNTSPEAADLQSLDYFLLYNFFLTSKGTNPFSSGCFVFFSGFRRVWMFLFDGFSWILLCLEMDGTQLEKKKGVKGMAWEYCKVGP